MKKLIIFVVFLTGCGNSGSAVVNTIVVPNTSINGSGSINTSPKGSCTRIDVYEILEASCPYGAVLFQTYTDKGCTGEGLDQYLGSQTICHGSPNPLPSVSPLSSPSAIVNQVSSITFCPTLSGGDGFPETGIYIGPELYAVYAKGQNIHFTRLTPGNYVTTDGRNCQFTVNQDNSVSYN